MKINLLNKILGVGLLLSVLAIPVKADYGIAVGISGNLADFTTSTARATGLQLERLYNGTSGNLFPTAHGAGNWQRQGAAITL